MAPTLGPPEARGRIAALRAEIARHDELYFKQAAPVISDEAYDRLKRELAGLEREFPVAGDSAPPAAGPGDDRTGGFATWRHLVPMLSLTKAYTRSELQAFDTRLRRRLGGALLTYVIEPKYDGLAVSVTYERGRLVRVVTRGNGSEGDDVTANLRACCDLPEALRAGPNDGEEVTVPDRIELRGEAYVTHAEFARLNREREEEGEAPFGEPRNLAAGTLKQVDPTAAGRRRLDVVFYGLGACEPESARPESQQTLLRRLRAWGLPTVAAPQVARGIDETWKAVQAFGQMRSGLPFPTDGAVVKLDAVAAQEKLGATAEAPLWATAFKFAPPFAETRLKSVAWQVGRTGVVTPVAELFPVRLGGVTIGRVTLHNRDEIKRLDLRIDDSVYIEKAGEVIPALAGVDLARRGSDALPCPIPTVCPECAAVLVGREEATLRCPNTACPAQIQLRVEYFASAGCVGIAGVGPSLVRQLVEQRGLRTPAGLYRLTAEDLRALGPHFAGKASRLLTAIEQSKHAELWRFIRGLGIPRVGEAAAHTLASRFGSLPALVRATRSDFAREAPSGARPLSDLAVEAVLSYFARPENQALVAELLTLGVEPGAPGRRTLP